MLAAVWLATPAMPVFILQVKCHAVVQNEDDVCHVIFKYILYVFFICVFFFYLKLFQLSCMWKSINQSFQKIKNANLTYRTLQDTSGVLVMMLNIALTETCCLCTEAEHWTIQKPCNLALNCSIFLETL